MLLTRTNWLVTLRDDILARQTLYPDGGDVGSLTKTNWLVKLRNDILARQTLYPSSGYIGPIYKTNWLRKLRHEILTTQMLYPEAGMASLARTIAIAQKLLDDTQISIDGTDISTKEFWVPQDAHDALQSAINTANAVLSAVTDDEDPRIKPAIQELNNAANAFYAVRKRGSMIIAVGWELTYSQPSQVTMQRVIIPLSSFEGYDPSKLADMNSPIGVYDENWNATGNVKLFAKYTMLPEDSWFEVSLDDSYSHRPYNRLVMWEWETPNIRISGDNSTSQPISLRLVLGG